MGRFVEGALPANLTLTVEGEQETLASASDPFALIGRPEEVVACVMSVVTSQGLDLSEGDVIITGSVVTPIAVSTPERVRVSFGDLGAVSVTLS